MLEAQDKLLEAQRLQMRTEYDLEMLQEMGFCSGIENYSRHLSRTPARLEALHVASIFSRRIFCWSSMNRTPPSRKSAECTKAIARAKPCWSITGFVSRARSTIAR